MPQLSFDVLWRDRGAAKGLRNLGTEADRTRGRFDHANKAIGGGMAAAAGVVTKFGAAGALALGAAGAAAVGFGVKVASGNEQARISFSTMLGSAQKADKFLRQLQKFAATTPFEFPELQTAASSLISAGIEADKVIPIMRTLGDVTSGMGTGSEGVRRATVALQQMNAAGRITGEDLNQLRDAGIPVYDLLAEATGKSKAEVVKLAQAGKLGREELGQMMKALESGAGLERFSGLMDKQSKSLAGMASTLKDTLGQGLANAVAPTFPLIKSGLESVSAGLGSVFGWISNNRTAFTSLFGTAGDLLKSFGNIAKGAFVPFVASLTDGQASFRDFANYIATHQGDIVGGFLTFAKGSVKFGLILAQVISGALRGFGAFSDAVSWLVSSSIDNFGILVHQAAAAFGWIPGLGPKLLAAQGRFDAFANNAHNNIKKTGDAARGLADGIDGRMVPALKAAGRGIDSVAKKEIVRAQVRDAVEKARLAVQNLGTAADGSQIRLKRFADRSKLSANEQAALRVRLSNASQALRTQISAMRDAGAGQAKLSRAWEIGRDRLYKEFRQMGLSRDEAKRLARQYAGIKPKVSTKIEQPGMAGARKNTRGLDSDINSINSKSVNVRVHYSAEGRIALQRQRAGKGIPKALGGVLPGWSPGRDIHTFTSPTGGKLLLSGGEAVMRPEFTRAVGGAAAIDRINADAKAGRIGRGAVHGATAGFAAGGVFRTISVHGQTNDPPNVRSQYAGAVSDASAYASAWARAEAKRIAAAEVARQRAAIRAAARRAARAAARASLGGGGGHKMSGSIISIARSFHPSYIAGHRDPQGGPAYDIGSSGAKNNAIANALRVNHGRLGLRYVISQMRIASARSGWGWRRYSPITGSGDFRHVGHVHVSYDRGGIMRGAGVNTSGKPERVLSPRQTVSFERLVKVMDRSGGGAVGTTIIIQAPNYVGSQEDLRRTLVDMDRRGQLTVLKRNPR